MPGFLNAQKPSNYGVHKKHTRNLFKMQIPRPELLIPYVKGRLCLRSLVVEITCLKQLLTIVRKLSGDRRPGTFSPGRCHGRQEVISVPFQVFQAYWYYVLPFLSLYFTAGLCRVVMRRRRIAIRLSTWILVLAHSWIKN